MKKQLLLFLLVFLANIGFAQETIYSRVQLQVSSQDIVTLANLGISLDDGVSYDKGILTGEFSEHDLLKLTNNNFNYDVLIEDLTAYYINKIQNSGPIIRSDKTPDNFNLGSMGGNLTLSEMLAELDDMQTLYPDLISVKQEITTDYTSHNGNYVYWVKISDNPSVDENEPEVLYTALHHAREPVSMMQLVYLMWYMLENYEDGGEAQYLIDNFEMYFILCENPDGYLYNEQTNPNGGGMWRKNRRDNGGGSWGVDPNRNYPYMWGYDDTGSSQFPDDETYRGPSAASEPITQMMLEFVAEHEFLICDNHHTYSNLLLYSWAYDEIHSPHNAIFSAYADIMTRVNGYGTGQPWEILYAVNGDSNDWMYGEHDVLAFTSETGDEFWPSQSEIIPLCDGNLEMNLFQTRLAGMYAEVTDQTASIVPAYGYIDFDIHFLGLDTLGTFTVFIESDDLAQIGEPVVFTDYVKLEHREDFIYYQVNEDIAMGDDFTFTLYVDNGLYAYSQEITKTVGKVEVIIEDPGDDLINWTSDDWTSTEETYHSSFNSITDSEGGDYSSNENSTITLTNAIDLSSYSSATLNFWAKWDIENNWDYVQLQISTNGGSTWTAMEGQYTNPGSSNQPSEPLYDGYSEWVKETISLDNYLQDNVKFRFQLISDESVVGDGFYFDDFTIIYLDATNEIPVITAQDALSTSKNNPIDIALDNLTVTDADNVYPQDFVLLLTDGDNYSVQNNTIIPDANFTGTLNIPARVNDGYDYSEPFNLIVEVEPTSINELDNLISIVPNPAANYFIIHTNNTQFNSVQVTDISGKVVFSQTITNTDNIKINSQTFESGIYFVKLSGNENITKKVIIL